MIAAILLIVFAIISWRSRVWGVFIILATLPSYLIRFQIGPIPTTALESMIYVLFLTTVFGDSKKWLAVAKRFYRGDLERWLAPLLLFLLAATVAVFIAPDTRAALGIWKAYFIDPLIFLWVFLTVVHTKEDRDLALWGLRITALFVASTTLLQWLTEIGIPPPWDAERRATGVFPFPNAVGLLLAPLATLFRAGFIREETRTVGWRPRFGRWWIKISHWRIPVIDQIVAVIAVLAMLAAKSEAGIIAVAAGVCYYGIFRSRRTRVWALGTLSAALIAFVVLLITNYQLLITQKLTLRDWSGTVRRIGWEETADLLRDHPILGVGLSGFPTALVPYHWAKIEIFQYPHNFILNFWSEMGILGLLAFLWIVAQFYRSSPLALDAVMTTILVHGLVDVPYFKNDLAVLFWILVGFAMLHDLDKARKMA